MQIDGIGVRLHFEHECSGLDADGDAELRGFAGADHKFHWAEARIAGDSVVVFSVGVARPVEGRYAWADKPALQSIQQGRAAGLAVPDCRLAGDHARTKVPDELFATP